MLNFAKGRRLLRRLQRNQDGNITVTFAISSFAVIGCMGAAMNFSAMSNAQARSQTIADQTALSAAIYMSYNDQPPTESDAGYAPGVHSAKSLGYEYKGWVDGGAENVKVNIVYDDVAKEAHVTVSGKNKPTFVKIFGDQDLMFSASSSVAYEQKTVKNPVSVLFVLDHSFSMNRDDRPDNAPGAQSRINGLKQSLTNFRQTLSEVEEGRTEEDPKVIRTGIVGFNRTVSSSRVDPHWGIYSEDIIENMHYALDDRTNSSVAMNRALEWLEDEEAAHVLENSEATPKNYVIFMTDGANTERQQSCVNIEFPAHRHWKNRRNNNVTHNPIQAARNTNVWIRENVSEGIECVRNSQWDAPTQTACNAMKDTPNTEVFTIGYALQPGSYYRQGRPNAGYSDVNIEESARAYHLLRNCASSENHFLEAENSDVLNLALSNIGNTIVQSTIRIVE